MIRGTKIIAVLALLAICSPVWAVDVNDPNLIAYWKLDEGAGTIAYDSAGTNDGTIYGATWTTGQIDGALNFDGADDYVRTLNNIFTNAQLASGATLTVWFKTDSTAYGLIADVEGYMNLGANHIRATTPNKICGIVDGGYHRFFSTSDVTDNFWHHAAIVWDGAGTAYLYLDGVCESSGTSGPPTPDRKDRPFTIGAYSGISAYFTGSVDDVRVYDRALSAEEVRQLHLNGLSAHERAIIQIEDAIAEKQEICDAIDETLEKEYAAYNALVELLESGDFGALNKRDIVKARQQIHSAIKDQERSMNTLDKSIEKLEDALSALGWEPEPELDPNLVAYWKFDEGTGTIAYDSAGTNHGTLVNGPIWTTGQIDAALSFDGVDDYVDVGDPPDGSLDFGANDNFTISAWIICDNMQIINQIVNKRKGGGLGGVWREGYIFRVFKNKLYLAIEDTSGNRTAIRGNTEITSNQWYFVAAVRDSATDKLYLYVDGISDAMPVEDTTTGSLSGSKSFEIGHSLGTILTGHWYFDGIIDDVRLYNRALSAEEIQQVYQGGL